MPDVPAGKEFAVGITEITKSHQTNSTAAGKASPKKEWKLSDSPQEKII